MHRPSFAIAALALSLLLSPAWGQQQREEVLDLPERAGSVSSSVLVQESELLISPADELEIKVFQVEELSGLRKVNSRGQIRMPLIGSVAVAGLSVSAAEARLTELLAADYLVDPDVNIDIVSFASQEVTVLGAVKKPGVYQLAGPTTLLQAIAMAQGIGKLADQTEVIIFRRSPEGGVIGYIVDFRNVVRGRLQDPMVAGSDRIVVPESGSKSLFSNISNTLRGFVRFEQLNTPGG